MNIKKLIQERIKNHGKQIRDFDSEIDNSPDSPHLEAFESMKNNFEIRVSESQAIIRIIEDN